MKSDYSVQGSKETESREKDTVDLPFLYSRQRKLISASALETTKSYSRMDSGERIDGPPTLGSHPSRTRTVSRPALGKLLGPANVRERRSQEHISMTTPTIDRSLDRRALVSIDVDADLLKQIGREMICEKSLLRSLYPWVLWTAHNCGEGGPIQRDIVGDVVSDSSWHHSRRCQMVAEGFLGIWVVGEIVSDHWSCSYFLDAHKTLSWNCQNGATRDKDSLFMGERPRCFI